MAELRFHDKLSLQIKEGEAMSDLLFIEVIKASALVLAALVAALVPSLAALLINRFNRNRKQLESDLKTALSDIAFLIAVESEHGKFHAELSGKNNLRTIRKIVCECTDLKWSGKFTQHRISQKLQMLERD